MNFEPSCVKGCYKSLFSTNEQQYSILGKLGSTRTNLIPTVCDQNIMARHQKDFHQVLLRNVSWEKSTFEHKATKSGYKLPNREKKNWGKAPFLGFLIKVLLSFYRGGVEFTSFDQLNITTNIKSTINFQVSPRKSLVVFGHLLQSSVGNLPK